MSEEVFGTKPKRWLTHPETNERWLMKDATFSHQSDGPRERSLSEFCDEIASDCWTATASVSVTSSSYGEADVRERRTPPLCDLAQPRGSDPAGGGVDATDSGRWGKDEPDNSVNPRAILLNTRTGARVGYVPDCLVEMIHELRDLDAEVEVTAEHVNPDTAPPHMRLLCRLAAPWPDGYEPLSGPEYQPIAQSAT